MGRKHRRKHDHQKPREDKPAPVLEAPRENPNAQHCEAIHQECHKKEEPAKWSRNPEWGKVIAESAIAFFTSPLSLCSGYNCETPVKVSSNNSAPTFGYLGARNRCV